MTTATKSATKSKGNAKDRPGPASPGRRSTSSRDYYENLGFPPDRSPKRGRGRPPGEQSGDSSSSEVGNAPAIDSNPPGEAQVKPVVGGANPPSRTRQPATRKDPLVSRGHVEAVPVPDSSSALPASFEVLAERIRKSHELYRELGNQSKELGRRRIEVARNTGQMLIEAKEQAPRKWETSVVKEFGMRMRTARIYMQVAKNWVEVEQFMNANRQRAAGLSLRAILKHLAKPKVKQVGGTERTQEPRPLHSNRPTPLTGDELTPHSVAKQPSAKDHQAAGAGSEQCEPADGDAQDQDANPKEPAIPDAPESMSGGPTQARAVENHAVGQADAKSRTTELGGDAEPAEDSETVEDMAKVVDKERSVVRSASTGSADVPVVERLEEYRQHLRASLRSIKPSFPATDSERAASRTLYADSQSLQEGVARLFTAKSAAEWVDCDKCRGSGLDRLGRPCRACASLGLVLASESIPTDDADGPGAGGLGDDE